MSRDRQADLTADLLRDLEAPHRTGQAPARPASTPAPERPSRRLATPALSLTLTPLQWSWPVLRRADTGVGVVAGLGPWQVRLLL